MLEEHGGRALDASRWVCEEESIRQGPRCDNGTREQHHVIRLNRMTRGGHLGYPHHHFAFLSTVRAQD